MKCKLCLLEKPLSKKSHIIPDFMYQGFYDEHHKIFKIKVKNPSNYTRQPSGEYEGSILCAHCDNVKIGKFENYAARVLFGGSFTKDELPLFENQVNQYGVAYTQIQNLDYKKFKLFMLTILWKASISKRDFFKNVKLGQYEEKVREMIYHEDPKEPQDFACFISTIRRDLEYASQLTVEPSRVKAKQGSEYQFLIGGDMYLFHVPKFNGPIQILEECVINKSGEMKVIHVREGTGEDLLKTFLGFKT